MFARGLFRSVPRTIALLGVLPFLLLVLWFTAHVAQKNRAVSRWPLVLAQVVSVEDQRVTLQFLWHGDMVRADVKREYAFAKLAPMETITLLANPANPAELSAPAFGDVWAGTVALGIVSGFLAIVFVAMLFVGAPRMPAHVVRDIQRMREAAARKGQGFDTSDDFEKPVDNGVIELHEPRQSWKANVFWGLILGLPAVLPLFLAGPEIPPLEK